jgi:hypothetical protein
VIGNVNGIIFINNSITKTYDPSGTGWRRKSVTFTFIKNDYLGHEIFPHIYNADSVKNVKLEKGNKATDWTPAPEDIFSAIDLKANIASPSFTGIPLAPTAATATNNNQIATTAFVKSQNYLTGITKAQVEAVLTGNISSHTHPYLPLAGGTITGSVYNMLELKRSDANGSSILFSNSAGNLGKLGFTSNGVFHLGTGTSTNGVGNLLQISTTGATTFYNSVTAPTFIGALSGNAATSTSSQYLISSGSSIVSSPGTGRIRYDYGVQSGTAGLFPISDNSNAVLSLNRHSGNYDSQLGFSSNGNIYYRKFSNVALDTTTP